MPQQLTYLLLPTESISPQLSPVLAATLNRVTIFRTLDPEHGEPFVSGSLLLLSQSIPPSELLTRWRIQSPLGYNIHLSGLNPFPDFWIPLKTARQIAKDLGLLRDLGNLLDWSTRRMSSWFEGVGPDGVGVMAHNWKLPTGLVGAEVYSHEMMTRTPFTSDVVFLPDHQPLRTYLSASTLADLQTISNGSLLPSNVLPIWHSLILLTSQIFESFFDNRESISSSEDPESAEASEWSGAVAVVWLGRVLSPFIEKDGSRDVGRGDVELVMGDLLRGLRLRKRRSKPEERESRGDPVKIEEEKREHEDLEEPNGAEHQGAQDGKEKEEIEERRKTRERTSVRWKVASQIIETLGVIVSGWIRYELSANDLNPNNELRSFLPPSTSPFTPSTSSSPAYSLNLDDLAALIEQTEKTLTNRFDEQSLALNTFHSNLKSSGLQSLHATSVPHFHRAQKERSNETEREVKIQLTILALICSNLLLAASVCYLLHISSSIGTGVQQEQQLGFSVGELGEAAKRKRQRDGQRWSTGTLFWALLRWLWKVIVAF
ncbi:hypothetical protein [Phaffia rhodozyma]|uniref:Uncharacterized protein n=1 Tax=Phaffia rhodozyma TaxID=264483 RepID=A0A0F7SRY0_PHARH|nr:hypothetical protein [Phaffia rhodozyma]